MTHPEPTGCGEDIVWSDEVDHLVAAATVEAPLDAQISEWLTAEPAGRVADMGCGPGSMTLALLARNPSARVDAIDGEPMMLATARRRLAAEQPGAQVRFWLGDLERMEFPEPAYDLIWAGSVVHHLPDEQGAANRFARLLAPNGRLALGEGGLPLRCLPYDLGVGRPGLEARLSGAEAAWFDALRAAIPGAVRSPGAWPQILARAGLVAPMTRSFLFEVPAPLPDAERAYVLHHLQALYRREGVLSALDEEDRETLQRLLDPADEVYVARRDDTFLLTARSVHVGRRPSH
jgi:SAM-dependent methyltransferase